MAVYQLGWESLSPLLPIHNNTSEVWRLTNRLTAIPLQNPPTGAQLG